MDIQEASYMPFNGLKAKQPRFAWLLFPVPRMLESPLWPGSWKSSEEFVVTGTRAGCDKRRPSHRAPSDLEVLALERI